MTNRLRAAALLAAVAGLLAAAEVVWLVVFLNDSADGPAFAMALVSIVLVPTLLVAILAVLIDVVPRPTRVAAVAAVAVSGLTAAGVEAGIFMGDDPTGPLFIRWVAALPPFALVAAVLLVGFAVWGPLRTLPLAARLALTIVAAIVTPVVLAMFQLTAMPLVMLVALVTVSVVRGRQLKTGLRSEGPHNRATSP